MSKLIIVCGLAGSGKTTLSHELSRKLNICALHNDTIKEALHELLDSQVTDARELYYFLAEEQMKNNVDLILDSPFLSDRSIERLKKWEEQYDLDIICVICKVSVDIRKKRILERNRDACHKENDKRLIENLSDVKVDYKRLPGIHIEVKTDEPQENLVENIIKELKL